MYHLIPIIIVVRPKKTYSKFIYTIIKLYKPIHLDVPIHNFFRGKPFRRRAKHTNPESLDDVNMDDDEDIPVNSQNGTRHSRKFCDTSGGV